MWLMVSVPGAAGVIFGLPDVEINVSVSILTYIEKISGSPLK